LVVGMTLQVSDIAATSRRLRRRTLAHGALAFVFNIALLAPRITIIANVIWACRGDGAGTRVAVARSDRRCLTHGR
jgi:hypothetical protein